MSTFPAQADTPIDFVMQRVIESDVFVAIVGFRYGQIIPGDSRSYQEFEFDEATKAGIPRLVFLIDDDVVAPREFFLDAEPQSASMRYRDRLRQSGIMISNVSSTDHLETELLHALTSLSSTQKRTDDAQSIVLLATRSSFNFCTALTQQLSGTVTARIWPLAVDPDSGVNRGKQLISWLRDAELCVVVLGAEYDTAEAAIGWKSEVSESGWYEIGLAAGAMSADGIEVFAPPFPRLPASLGYPTLAIPSDGLTAGFTKLARDVILGKIYAPEFSRPSSGPPRYTCFLSYAQADSWFVDQLYVDLQESGITCWLDRERIEVGQKWHEEIYRGLGRSDKLLLIMSSASATSRWVEIEAKKALELERMQSRQVLMPIRLDSAVLDSPNDWVRDIVANRQIADFESWKNEDQYRRSLRRLVREITVSAASDTLRVP